jgi:hypothetical protein
MERKLQDAKGIVIAHFTVGLGSSQWPVGVLAARADQDFANAALRICFSIGVLRCEALVVVIMPINNNFDSRVI